MQIRGCNVSGSLVLERANILLQRPLAELEPPAGTLQFLDARLRLLRFRLPLPPAAVHLEEVAVTLFQHLDHVVILAGEVLVDPEPDTQMDDTPTKWIGQGGNGIEIYPNVYNGWVQKMPEAEKAKLTCKQREPLKAAVC